MLPPLSVNVCLAIYEYLHVEKGNVVAHHTHTHGITKAYRIVGQPDLNSIVCENNNVE